MPSVQVSVMLPVYNGEEKIRNAVESVLEQDYRDFEFIIVNNASSDDTAKIIREYCKDKRVKLFHNEVTIPRLENFIKAFSLASPESRWLKFIGDDDRLLPSCLSEMVRVGEEQGGMEKIGIVSSYHYIGDELQEGFLPAGQESLVGAQILRKLLLEPRTRIALYSPASILVSQKAYLEFGPFNSELLHADSELFYRIMNSYDFAFVHKPLTVTGYHSASGQAKSTEKGDTFREAYLIRYKNIKLYNNLSLSPLDVEKIKFNLVNDSTGFILARLAAGNYKRALNHLAEIPVQASYYLPVSLIYFIGLGIKKMLRGEKFKVFNDNKR